MSEFQMLGNKKYLTLLLIKESKELTTDLNSFQELFLFLARYAFIINIKSSESENLKRQNPSRGELFSQNSNGARYLDPKYSRWLSTDPALTSYVEKNYEGPSGGIYNSVNLNLYHYGGNNPIKYVDPDGREEKIPVPLTGYIGIQAHNTAYPIVSAAIQRLGYSNVHSNKGMYMADGSAKINRKRPDWQNPTGDTLLLWEMKPHSIEQAQSDISFYVIEAAKKGQHAEAGPALGKIVERQPIENLYNVYMDITSPSPGVVIYSAYTIIPDSEPESVKEREEVLKDVGKTALITAGAVGGGYLVWRIAKVVAAAIFAPPLIPAAALTP